MCKYHPLANPTLDPVSLKHKNVNPIHSTLFQYFPESYSEPWQTSTTKHFARIANGFQPFYFRKTRSILDVWQGYE